jgi:hypothetical protein
MIAIRLVPFAAIAVLGLTVSAAAQMLGPGTSTPGQAPPQQQTPPCFADFKPLRDEAEKHGLALKNAIQKKISREEACTLIKSYAAAEAKVVEFIQANAGWCGIPAEAATSMKTNHTRTLQSEKQVCSGGGKAGGPRIRYSAAPFASEVRVRGAAMYHEL